MTDHELKGIAAGGSIQYGQGISFTLETVAGEQFTFRCITEDAPRLLVVLKGFMAEAEARAAAKATGQAVRIGNAFQAIDQQTVLGFTSTGHRVLVFRTAEDIPLEVAMSPKEAEAIGRLLLERGPQPPKEARRKLS